MEQTSSSCFQLKQHKKEKENVRDNLTGWRRFCPSRVIFLKQQYVNHLLLCYAFWESGDLRVSCSYACSPRRENTSNATAVGCSLPCGQLSYTKVIQKKILNKCLVSEGIEQCTFSKVVASTQLLYDSRAILETVETRPERGGSAQLLTGVDVGENLLYYTDFSSVMNFSIHHIAV